MENPPPVCTDFVYFTWVTIALQSQCRGYSRDDSHRDASKSPKVFPGCEWVPCTKVGDYCCWKWDCFCTYHALAVSNLEPNPVIFSIKSVVGSVSSLISLLSWNNYYWGSYSGKPMSSGFTLLLLVALWETKNMLWFADWTAMRSHSDNEGRGLQSWFSWNQNLGYAWRCVTHCQCTRLPASHWDTWGTAAGAMQRAQGTVRIHLRSSWGCPHSHAAAVCYCPCSEVLKQALPSLQLHFQVKIYVHFDHPKDPSCLIVPEAVHPIWFRTDQVGQLTL